MHLVITSIYVQEANTATSSFLLCLTNTFKWHVDTNTIKSCLTNSQYIKNVNKTNMVTYRQVCKCALEKMNTMSRQHLNL